MRKLIFNNLKMYGLTAMMILPFSSCQLVEQEVSYTPKLDYQDIVDNRSLYRFYIYYYGGIYSKTSNTRMYVAKGQLESLIATINNYDKIWRETMPGEYYPDGTPRVSSSKHHAFFLCVYKGDEEIVSMNVSPDRYLDDSGLKMYIGSYFTEKSWRRANMEEKDPKYLYAI